MIVLTEFPLQDGRTCIHNKNIDDCPLCDFYQAHQFGFSKEAQKKFVDLRMQLFDLDTVDKDDVIEEIIDIAYKSVFSSKDGGSSES